MYKTSTQIFAAIYYHVAVYTAIHFRLLVLDVEIKNRNLQFKKSCCICYVLITISGVLVYLNGWQFYDQLFV